jgi:hypothetical protein
VSRSLGGEEGKALGLSAFVPYVSLTALVPKIWMCGLRAVYVLSAIEPASFFAGFGNLPVQGKFCRNFLLIVLFSLFCRAGPVRGDSEHLGIALPGHCTDSPLRR